MENQPEFKSSLKEAVFNGDLAKFRKEFEPKDLDSDDYGGTLLHFACKWGSLEFVQFLLDQGADVNRRGDTFDAVPATYAAKEGKLDIVRYLVELGSVLDTSHSLRNPLMHASKEGHCNVVDYLMTTAIDPHATYRTPTGTLINALS